MQKIFTSYLISTLLISSAYAGHHHDRNVAFSFQVPGANVVVAQNQPVTTVTETTYVTSSHHHHHGNMSWVQMRTGYPIPAGAVVGGGQPNPPATLHVCHAYYNNGVHPGKLINGYCNIGWGGQEISLSDYEVLVSSKRLGWINASNGYVPPNAVEGGEVNGQPLYVCQADYMGGTHPGKVVGPNCNIGWGGQEATVPFYKVLVR